ncbi:CbiX/SirB N-terminal domain-containing protein [Desulfomicrobium sp. ZS1]|uniref:sirohydrochlorin chelatase n=1 Tax=Desulfomicrobium sp. ZS1 TaxID=2952228 RepID=UPI0020B3D736|nr:CbiX/SirB N-terminal domain-containing protein [Desulfomicrobium sp. ZS1]UTF49562.1 CbiX/SirB N-terminal domain-containing protein [Desulfomicrobium sp. ZS1]
MHKTGMIVLGHGSRRKEVALQFTAMVGRVASRIAGAQVLPAFFSLGEPTLADQVRELAERGCTRIVVMQYFLYNGVHIEQDIPQMIAALREEFPGVEFVIQPTLQDDPALERLLVDRLFADGGE